MSDLSRDDLFDILNRKMSEIKDQLARVEACYKALYCNEDVDISFLESELYTEETSDKRGVLSHTSRAIEHLLKLKYCTNNRNYDKWIGEFNDHRNEVIDILEYPDTNKNLLNYLIENFEKSYNRAISFYNSDISTYKDLDENKDVIPKELPITVNDFISESLHSLLDKLPDPDELTTQMQLYPFCQYYGDSHYTRGFQCKDCDNYNECIYEYYGRK